MFGVLVVSGALTADAFVGNTQEGLFKQGASLVEAVTWCSLVSCTISFASIFLTDDVSSAISDTLATPKALMAMISIGIVNYVGLSLILTMIHVMGAAQTVFFTSLRKGCTLLLSYVLFPKPLTLQHLLGGVLIGAGILLNDRAKRAVATK